MWDKEGEEESGGRQRMKGCRPQSYVLPRSPSSGTCLTSQSLSLLACHQKENEHQTVTNTRLLVLTPVLWSRCYRCYIHSADEETEAQKGPVAHPVRGRAGMSQALGSQSRS